MIRVTFTQHSGKRHRQQQDALWNGHGRVQEPDVPITSLLLPGGRVLLAIADGVAVSPFPHLASRFVVETLAVVARPSGLSVKAVRDLHQRLCERYAKGNTRGASATLVAAEFSADTCRIVNAGDSRAYLITDCGHWSQLSRDHSILNDLIESGEADADTEYARIYGGLAHCLTADFEDHDFAIHQASATFPVGHRLLLCSDGVHDLLGDRLQRLSDPAVDSSEQVKTWRRAVLAAGAPDNFSIILAERLPDPL